MKRIYIWLMRCVAFDHVFLQDLAAKQQQYQLDRKKKELARRKPFVKSKQPQQDEQALARLSPEV